MLAAHNIVSSTVCLASNDGNLGHGALSVSVKQLSTLANDTAVLLRGTGEEARHVYKGKDGDVEGVAKANEAASLHTCVNIEAACLVQGLVSNHTNGPTFHASKADNDVLCKVRHDLKELLVVYYLADDRLHIIRDVRVRGHHAVERLICTINGIAALALRQVSGVAKRQKVKELTRHAECFDIIVIGKVSYTGLGGMRLGATKVLLGHYLVGHGLHDVRAGNKHVRRVTHHGDKVSERGRVHCASCARAHDERELGNHARGFYVTLEHFSVATKRVYTLLDSGSTRVVQADHGCAVTHSHVHDFADFLSMGFGQRSTENGKILAENVHGAAINVAVTSDHTITIHLVLLHAKVSAPVHLEHIGFAKASLIKKDLKAFPSRELSLCVLLLYPLRSTTCKRVSTGSFELFAKQSLRR
mmetsp:Transcript_1669/g.3277  ORF Transcript_1669/g.3277 Transcript_1669/m.3277 type:complete len:416 (-) Transcript_1669:224-1471(-)